MIFMFGFYSLLFLFFGSLFCFILMLSVGLGSWGVVFSLWVALAIPFFLGNNKEEPQLTRTHTLSLLKISKITRPPVCTSKNDL